MNNELRLLQFGYFRTADLSNAATEIINSCETIKMQRRFSLSVGLLELQSSLRGYIW